MLFRPSHFTFNGSPVPEFSEEALKKALDSFVSTIGYVALLVALSNPVLLFGLPVEEKFGINGPVSGFFEDWQAEHLRALIPEGHRKVLVSLADADGRVEGMREYFSSCPDLTVQELAAQFQEFRQQFPQAKGTNE